MRLGRLQRYNHTSNLTYNLPFNKIPATDWVSGNVRYGATYNWQTSPLYRDSVTNEIVPNPFANTIQNSQTIAYNANLTFTTLYNKVPS